MHHPVTAPTTAPAAVSQQGYTIANGSCYSCQCDISAAPVKAIDSVLKMVGLKSKEYKAVVICECLCHGQKERAGGR